MQWLRNKQFVVQETHSNSLEPQLHLGRTAAATGVFITVNAAVLFKFIFFVSASV